MSSTHLIKDSFSMFRRCMLISLRKPDALVTSIVAPVCMMLLFVLVFGESMNVGGGSFVNFIVPGVLLQCIGQCATFTAMTVNEDLTKGIFDRFRSMPIAKSAVLTGHVLAATARNIIATTAVIGAAFLVGFRPEASFVQWLGIAGVLLLFMLAITWLSVVFGIAVKSTESAGALMIPVTILPYISSGFVPVESIAAGLQSFAQHQPMTPIIDTVRALSMGLTAPTNTWQIAVLWCVGIITGSYLVAVQMYRRRMSG